MNRSYLNILVSFLKMLNLCYTRAAFLLNLSELIQHGIVSIYEEN